jgi:hypothetical protein
MFSSFWLKNNCGKKTETDRQMRGGEKGGGRGRWRREGRGGEGREGERDICCPHRLPMK